jgi:hypothetical protein
MPKPRAALLTLAFVLSAAAPDILVAADLRVDQLELLSHGELNEETGSYEVGSRLFFDLSMEGGDKFAGLLKLDFLNGNVEKALNLANSDADSSSPTLAQDLTDRINNLTSPRLRTVAVTARSMFGLPLDLCYFVGEMDAFCSGDDFVPLFGAAPFATEIRGPMVYPDGLGGNPRVWYNGIYAANGTGFRIATTPKLSEGSVGYLYFYQDSNIGPGTWSGDLRFLSNGSSVKTEIFAGATTGNNESDRGLYRCGLLFFASSGDIGEFLAQMGVTRWDATKSLSLSDLYFLFEPRMYIGSAMTAITFFYHPSWYLQKDYRDLGEERALDMAFDLRFGSLSRVGAQGGIQTILAFRPESEDTDVTPTLAVDASPYYSLVSGGVRWDFKLDLRLFPFPDEWYGMFRPFIGLKTSY